MHFTTFTGEYRQNTKVCFALKMKYHSNIIFCVVTIHSRCRDTIIATNEITFSGKHHVEKKTTEIELKALCNSTFLTHRKTSVPTWSWKKSDFGNRGLALYDVQEIYRKAHDDCVIKNCNDFSFAKTFIEKYWPRLNNQVRYFKKTFGSCTLSNACFLRMSCNYIIRALGKVHFPLNLHSTIFNRRNWE